jgi:hypothetical protein
MNKAKNIYLIKIFLYKKIIFQVYTKLKKIKNNIFKVI